MRWTVILVLLLSPFLTLGGVLSLSIRDRDDHVVTEVDADALVRLVITAKVNVESNPG